MFFSKVAVVGVGLIGGSFALALKQAKLCGHVVGVGRGAANLKLALERGILDAVEPDAGRAVVDAGLKASSVDSGMPRVADVEGVEYQKASDEHGVLKVDAGARIAVGDKLRLIPGHCDPTVNLYDHYVCVRGGKVEALWPITARGAVW